MDPEEKLHRFARWKLLTKFVDPDEASVDDVIAVRKRQAHVFMLISTKKVFYGRFVGRSVPLGGGVNFPSNAVDGDS